MNFMRQKWREVEIPNVLTKKASKKQGESSKSSHTREALAVRA